MSLRSVAILLGADYDDVKEASMSSKGSKSLRVGMGRRSMAIPKPGELSLGKAAVGVQIGPVILHPTECDTIDLSRMPNGP